MYRMLTAFIIRRTKIELEAAEKTEKYRGHDLRPLFMKTARNNQDDVAPMDLELVGSGDESTDAEYVKEKETLSDSDMVNN